MDLCDELYPRSALAQKNVEWCAGCLDDEWLFRFDDRVGLGAPGALLSDLKKKKSTQKIVERGQLNKNYTVKRGHLNRGKSHTINRRGRKRLLSMTYLT